MPSKQETGTSSLPQEPPQKPPQVAFLKASPPFQAIPSPVQKAPPYQTANKEKKKKK
jgi:hypothetical protein